MNISFLTFSEKTELFARMSCAYVAVAFFFLLDHIATGSQTMQKAMPLYTLIVIYYWSIYRPEIMPLWLVFFLGLASDLISGIHLGFNALTFILMSWIVVNQRRVFLGQSFVAVFFGFVLVASAFFLSQWILFSFISMHFWPAAQPVLIKTVSTIIFFPFISIILRFVHRLLPSESQDEKDKRFSPIVS